MQITEQIIERISRRVFNTMFSPALRQSNVVIGGSGSSVSWAENAGHANSADTAGNADTVDNLHAIDIFRKIANSKDINFADGNNKNGIIYINKDGDDGTTTGFWGNYGSVLNISSSAASWQLGVDNGGAFKFRHRWWSGGGNDWSGWLNIMTSNNCSVSKSGSTLTVKINGTEQSLTDTNTWRPVVNNLSSTDTTSSLSAAMGKSLYDYITTLQGYFDVNGNAKSALKLTTVSKTAWGQTFWTSGGVPTSISGDMTSVGDISFAASGKNIGGVAYFDTANKRLGIGQSSPSYALDVNGGAGFSGDVLPNADYATTAYNLGLSDKRWKHVYANYVILSGTAPAIHCENTNGKVALLAATDRGVYDITGEKWLIGCNANNTFMLKGNVGIGTTSPGDDKLKVNGSIYTTVGLYSEGYVDGLAYNTASDKRLKDIIDYNAVPHIDDIANAPAIHFTWKNKRDKKIHVGTIAQYWQKITPECVHQSKRRFLTMNYDVIALVNTIALAREINALKHEIAELKNKAQ